MSDICTAADWARIRNRDDFFFLDPDTDIAEARTWWENLGPWFQERGYTMYEKVYINRRIDFYKETPSSVYTGTTNFPYAHIGGSGYCNEECSFRARSTYPRLVFAQDSLSRHVCIKLLRPNSDECKIISFLRQQSKLWDEANFPCVVPVLDVFSNTKYDFAVFPRWDGGMEEQRPWFNTMKEILDLIRCVLKGLCFLHENRIFHRDIHDGNILTNHFGCAFRTHMHTNELRQELRSTGQLTYALTDFDLSLMLPADTDIRLCELPIAESYPGVPEKPYGALHGEVYFNPFAYDVGCLGMALSVHFQHLCSSLPILAPLLSGMLTSNIGERFTAQEALTFLDENRPYVSEYELLKPAEREYIYDWDSYDRWSTVPPELSLKWRKYKGEQPSYFMRQVVGPLCQRLWGLNLVYSVRRFLLHFKFMKSIFRRFRKIC